MEWKQENIAKSELEKRQSDYTKMAMEMAKRAKVSPAAAAAEKHEKKEVFEHKPEEIMEKKEVQENKPEAPAPRQAEKHEGHIKTEVIEKAAGIAEKLTETKAEHEKKPEPVIEKVPEVIVKEVPVVEKETVVVERQPEIILNQSKTIEINADVNINAGALLFKGKEEPAEREEPVMPEPCISPEATAERIEECETTTNPFENFKCECDTGECGTSEAEHRQRHASANCPPPNFCNYINEHNKRAGGFSWRNFKKN